MKGEEEWRRGGADMEEDLEEDVWDPRRTGRSASSKRDVLKMQLDFRDIEIEFLPNGMERRTLNQSTWDFKYVRLRLALHQSILDCLFCSGIKPRCSLSNGSFTLRATCSHGREVTTIWSSRECLDASKIMRVPWGSTTKPSGMSGRERSG